jgi:deazaflavin-dependent oxidoreductase (nitroreductase family)
MRRLVQLVAAVRLLLAGFFSRMMRTDVAHRFVTPYLAPVQLWLYRRTGGRFHLSALLVPSLVLVTTGAKTGRRRETPLMCVPQPNGGYLVSGSNWGRPHHPAWTTNLIAQPDAEIVIRRRTVPIRARLLEGAEREDAWRVLEAQFPDYRAYERKAGRPVRIFRLEPR